MTKAIFTFMAVLLAAATVLSAATALAAPKKKKLPPSYLQPQIEEQVSGAVNQSSESILRLKLRHPQQVPPPPTVFLPSSNIN